MIKVTMLATLFAGIAMGTNIAADARSNIASEKRDAQIIVEVDRSLDSLTSEGVKNVQNAVYRNIKSYVTPNIRLLNSYSILNNAFAISINSNYIDAVKSLPGVKSVTRNEIHFLTPQVSREAEEIIPDPEHDYGGKDNASAETMNLQEGATNDGEGTVIAILDNEFYFKAESDVHHETFSDLDESVNVRFASRPDVTNTHAYKDDTTRKSTINKTELGKEGSLYYNRKVPYYFDYGGERDYYGGDYNEDFDVSSTISYHGSHVASIAAGNAEYYKGIAPKAQLVCMKVFTNYEASKVDIALGFQNSSGAYDIPILNALEDCIALGVDGINMSLGSNLDDFDGDSITMKTLTKLANEGILSAISAGNAGKTSYAFAGGYGNWTSDMVETGILSGYANSERSMTIAAGQPAKTFYSSAFKYKGSNISYQDQVVNVGNNYDYEEDEERRMSDLVKDKESKDLQWVYIPNFGSSADYTDKDVSGKIAVVNRGSIDFATKVTTAKDKGAIGVVIINNDPTASDFNFRCSFGDLIPTIPVALVLFKDKKTFEQDGSGIFTIVKDEVDVNPRANTISTFSSDGATFDLDLKPEITAPGENIRGAVPPQKKEDKQARPNSTYEFLSGTSMSAPNYAGAQAVVLSKKAVELRDDADAYNAYRKTVDMRLMSTAIPMYDYDDCPEVEGTKYQTSPRLQGAGMANIGGAYSTDVYLEGYDLSGNPIGKSKIALRNSEKINNGTVSLSFLAHNESNETRTYSASYTIMRPAIKKSNEIVGRNYKYRGEIDAISSFSGMSYWVEEVDTQGITRIVERHATGDVEVGDVFKVSREIKYNIVDPDDPTKLKEMTIAIGRYECTDILDVKTVDGETWKYANFEVYKSDNYQSTQDTLIAKKVITADIVIEPGDHQISLEEFNLSAEQKAEILDFYSYGTYLEGYVALESKDGHVNLSMPWMGFFAGDGQTYGSAPVVEPFNFEKDSSTIYPSELTNDIAYSLLGKSNVDMGSTWVSTYIEPGKSFNEDDILSNDESLSHLAKTNSNYHLLGTDVNGDYYDHPEDHLYVGNSHASNTMLVQQFVLRSVDDNYYTIKDKDGKVLQTDALQDMLFGERYGRYPLYKSHVDENYLGGGYVSHKAFAVIPLYDLNNGVSFPSGDYEITFNYKLAATGEWISKSYTLHILSDNPTVDSVEVLSNSLKFHFTEPNLAYAKVGSSYYSLSEAESSGSYIELSYKRIEQELNDNFNEVYGSGRLYIELFNKAYGRTGVIVRFGETTTGKPVLYRYTVAQSYQFGLNHDFEDLLTSISFVTYNASTYSVKTFKPDGYEIVFRGESEPPVKPQSSGCGGNIATTSILLASLAGVLAIVLVIAKKREKLGGKD